MSWETPAVALRIRALCLHDFAWTWSPAACGWICEECGALQLSLAAWRIARDLGARAILGALLRCVVCDGPIEEDNTAPACRRCAS